MADIVRHIARPDPAILRDQLVSRALREPPTGCIHPMSAVEQYVDEEPGREARPTNLFECTICHALCVITDFHGRPCADG